MTLDDRPPKLRWPRSQRFLLSPKGGEAEASYRNMIVASRSTEGRASYDAARASWAGTYAVEADDGLYLQEIASKPSNLSQLTAALETCGKTRPDAINALGRLFDAGLIAPAP
jgi:hypothetical protein